MLGFLADAARRYGEPRKLQIDVDPYFGERARVRLARLDAELPQHAQRLLFGEGVGAGVDPSAPYSEGWRLSPVPGRALWECEAIAASTLPAGALHPLPEERSRGGHAGVVEAWRRFDRLRSRDEGEFGAESSRARAVSSPSGALFGRVDSPDKSDTSTAPSLDRPADSARSALRSARPTRTARGA